MGLKRITRDALNRNGLRQGMTEGFCSHSD